MLKLLLYICLRFELSSSGFLLLQYSSSTPTTMPPIVWVDLEMTGLDITNDVILEIAVLLTDDSPELKPLAVDAQLHLVLHQPMEVLSNMNEWCKSHHGTSGLTQRVLLSTTTAQQAEDQVLAFLEKFQVSKGVGLLAGNSVHVDKQFLCKEMPRFVEFLHYRILDVSTVFHHRLGYVR